MARLFLKQLTARIHRDPNHNREGGNTAGALHPHWAFKSPWHIGVAVAHCVPVFY